MNSNTIVFSRDEGGILIIREGVNMVIIPGNFDHVSGNHADITRFEDGSFYLADHSRNGTLVNGQLINNTTVKITKSDRILLAGQYEVNWETVSNLLTGNVSSTDDEGRKTKMRTFLGENNERETVIHSPSSENNLSRKTRLFNQDNEPQPLVQPQPQPNVTITSHRDLKLALRKWNWGAFFLTFLWGLFRRIYWPIWLLAANAAAFVARALMPRDGVLFFWLLSYLANLGWFVMAFYLGLNGSQMAWKRKCYRNIQDFKRKEHRWAVVGVIVGLSTIIALTIVTILYSDQIDF